MVGRSDNQRTVHSYSQSGNPQKRCRLPW